MISICEEMKAWSRRLSIESVKQNAKQLSKFIGGANALIVFDNMVTNAKSYRNMIEA